MSKGDKQSRIDKKFLEDLEEVKLTRRINKLEKRDIGTRELTRMARNSSVYKRLLEELSTIPRRKNGK